MCNPNGTKLSLKVVINKQKSKVFFAEANSYVADVLLGFLTMPLAKIISILEQHGHDEVTSIGCLISVCLNLFENTNYSGQSDDDDQFSFMGSKSLGAKFRDMVRSSAPICRDSNCENEVSHQIGMCCIMCGESQHDRLLTKRDSTFVISDDLRVVPMHSGFSETLYNLGVSDISGAEIRNLSFGLDDAMNLLLLSLISSTPLTDLVFKKKDTSFVAEKSEFHHMMRGEIIPANINLKVSLQKSTNKFLFAEATEDFIEFLFSLVTLPLGEAVRRLDGKTPFNNINNLYNSIEYFIGDEYFIDQDTKTRLINPNINRGYFSSSNQIEKNYCNKQKVFVVNDDLTVEPFSMTSIVSILNGVGIPLSDVKQTEFHIGSHEALRILEACLVSKTVLTDVLIDPMLS